MKFYAGQYLSFRDFKHVPLSFIVKQTEWGVSFFNFYILKVYIQNIQLCFTMCIVKLLNHTYFMWIQMHQNCCSLCRRRRYNHLLHKPAQTFGSDIWILAQISASFSPVGRCLTIVLLLFEMTPEEDRSIFRYLWIVFQCRTGASGNFVWT